MSGISFCLPKKYFFIVVSWKALHKHGGFLSYYPILVLILFIFYNISFFHLNPEAWKVRNHTTESVNRAEAFVSIIWLFFSWNLFIIILFTFSHFDTPLPHSFLFFFAHNRKNNIQRKAKVEKRKIILLFRNFLNVNDFVLFEIK
jgi:hypothetical protein